MRGLFDRSFGWMLAVALVAYAGGCSCDDPTGDDGGTPDGATSMDAAGRDAGDGIDGGTGSDGGGGADGAIRDGGILIVEDGGGTFVCYVTSCGGHLNDCGDCMDNDGDGRVDARDPECLGPCDNTEGPILLAGVGGETGGPCRSDCYFDFGNGSGNDRCSWDHRCDPLEAAPRYDPEGMGCAYDASRVGGMTCPTNQPMSCLDRCVPLTPNGCDCFGCCTFDAIHGRPQAMGGEWVWIGSVMDGTNTGTCTLADVTDVDACRPCTPVADCFNDCGDCELCIGRDTLPPECTPGSTDGGVPPIDGGGSRWDGGVPPMRCPAGVQECGLPSDPNCPPDFYCITGCCQSIII
ncbi:MAG: hypothetical protein AB7S26_19690 [Sandaracinaceae bacterium]